MTDRINERLRHIERDLERSTKYRHEMRGEMVRTGTELAVIHAELNNLREDVKELADALEAREQQQVLRRIAERKERRSDRLALLGASGTIIAAVISAMAVFFG